MVQRKTISNISASLVVPFVLMAASIVWLKRHPFRPPEWDYAAQYVSAAAGFLFLVREFRLWALGIAIIYFPTMLYLLLGFALCFVGMVYGDWL